MPACQGKLSQGQPCPKTVEEGKTLCRWHDPDDQSWREIYERLRMATPEEKTEIVLGQIEDHPEHRLVLPERDGLSANLQGARLVGPGFPWFGLSFANLQGGDLAGANLHSCNLMYANLQGANFYGANLQGAFLIHANLKDANLREAELWVAYLGVADLQGTNFFMAKLQEAYLGNANLQDATLQEANLQDANLRDANLQAAYLKHANLRGASLQATNLQGANLKDANLQGANLTEAKLQDVDLSTVENMSNIYLSGAWLERNRMKRELFGDAIGEEQDHNYAEARRVYLALKQNFDDLGDYDAASWAYRKERRMEKLEARENGRSALSADRSRVAWRKLAQQFGQSVRSDNRWREAVANYFKFFSDTFVEWLCDYGENAWRVVGWMAVQLLVAGPLLFSGLGGLDWSQDLTRDYFALPSSLHRLWFWYYHYLLYTFDTFTTASFSGLQPANDAVKLASGFFAIAGIVLAGLLGFVAGNRIRRS